MSLPDFNPEETGYNEEAEAVNVLPDDAPKKKKRKVWKIAVAVFLTLLLVGAGVTAWYINDLRSSFNDNKSEIAQAFPSVRPTPSLKADYNGYTILMIGSDSRVSVDSNSSADQRSDSMMLVHIPTDRSHVYVTSIMRDTYVPIPGHGKGKINSAMSDGGIPLLVETIESLTNSRIDHVASVDFEGFRSLTEAMGGVTVTNPEAFTAQEGDYYPAGKIKLSGDYALNYVRERHAFVNSDYRRVQNQQDFLKAVFSQITSANTLSNPTKVQQLVKSFSPYITTDKDFDADTVASIGISLKNLKSSDIVSFTLNSDGVSETPEGESIILPDMDAFTKYGDAVNNETMENYKDFALPKE